ncbi:MAG: dTDP-4-dehydrorhamnose 3,5-epimerase [Patiriisocius sp.]|uniref:dTDP-4-dehydrorhamnose 3,5-epimerase n=1 Tax=Patiriisocius sp. TaxID=2822396 RepID=UPI003EF24E6E
MTIKETEIKDCFIIKPNVFEDERGYFMESFNASVFSKKTGIETTFLQDNQSFSSYGVIRGLHAQEGEFAQAKLVRVLQGEVLDVVIDARKDSTSYGKKVEIKLNADNKTQLFVPRGCLHGFAVLSQTATFFYKCDNYYDRASEIGVKFDDPFLDIDWQISENNQIISEKDMKLPLFKSL